MTDDIKPVAWAIFRDGALDWEHDQPFSDEPQSMMDDEESRPLYGGEVIAEIERLRAALKKANDQTEHFEREWYLVGDEVDRLRLLLRESTAWLDLSRREVAMLRRQRDVLLDMLDRSGVRYDEIARAIDRDARDARAEVGAKEGGE